MNDSFKNNLRQASKKSLSLVSICRTYQFVYEQPETDETHSKFRDAPRIFQDELQERNGIINGGTLCAGLILCTLSVGFVIEHPIVLYLIFPGSCRNCHGQTNYSAW